MYPNFNTPPKDTLIFLNNLDTPELFEEKELFKNLKHFRLGFLTPNFAAGVINTLQAISYDPEWIQTVFIKTLFNFYYKDLFDIDTKEDYLNYDIKTGELNPESYKTHNDRFFENVHAILDPHITLSQKPFDRDTFSPKETKKLASKIDSPQLRHEIKIVKSSKNNYNESNYLKAVERTLHALDFCLYWIDEKLHNELLRKYIY